MKYKVGDRVVNTVFNKVATIMGYDSDTNLYNIRYDDGYPGRSLENELLTFVENKSKPEPKFKVGDRICSKYHKPSNVLEIIEVIRGDGHYGYRIKNHQTNNTYYMWEYELSNYKLVEESNIDLTIKGEEVKERIEIRIPEGYEYVIESDKIIFTKKKKEYPKTYEECREIVKVGKEHTLEGEIIRKNNYKIDLLESFQKLLICRDAYWKLYGEEKGLGKPWESDYDSGVNKYGIICINGVVQESNPTTNWERHLNKVLDFPTEEMRDAFYENFKKEIEMCKELL